MQYWWVMKTTGKHYLNDWKADCKNILLTDYEGNQVFPFFTLATKWAAT